MAVLASSFGGESISISGFIRGGGSSSCAPARGRKFFVLGEISGVLLCESLDLLLFEKEMFVDKFPWGRKLDRFPEDSAPLDFIAVVDVASYGSK